MNKVFCVSCGFKNVYEVTKPKFCASCGSAVMGALAPKAPIKASVEIEIEEEEYEEPSVRSIDVRRLRRDIIAEANTSKTNLTDLWKSASPQDAENIDGFRRPSPNLPNGQDLIRLTQAECASSKPIDIDG